MDKEEKEFFEEQVNEEEIKQEEIENKEIEEREVSEKKEVRQKRKEKATKIWTVIKWVLGLAIIIAGIVFVSVNNELCYSEFQTPKEKDPEKQLVTLQKNSICTQRFKGYDGTLEKIGVFLDNQGKERSKGKVILNIKDDKGEMIATASRQAKAIRTRKFTFFHFEEAPQLSKDKAYTMEIQFVNFRNKQGFGIYTSKLENPWMLSTNINGNQIRDSYIRTVISFKYYDKASMTKMIGILVIGLLLCLIPFELLGTLLGKKINKTISIDKLLSKILYITAPFTAFFIMELMSGFTVKEIAGFLLLPKGILNLAIYYVLLLVFYAITNRTQYSAILLWVVTFVGGLTNYFVFSFRGVPVLAADILSVGTALNVADSFEYTYDIWVLWPASIFAAFTGLMLSLTPYKGFKLIKRAAVIAITMVVVIFANYFYIGSDCISAWGIEDSQWKPQLTYTKNGSALSFVNSWKYVTTEKPKNYSIKNVKKVTDLYKSDNTTSDAAKTKKMPNVIAIMNESLADFSYDGKIETTEDYLPFIRSLKENTIKGRVYVSIEGANTANSEFEFLTGNSLAFFAPRAVPYNNYVKNIVPSLTRTLAAQGYVGNNAYHPYKRSGWNRESVYNSLGFNWFYSEEHYEKSEYIRNFISDKTNMECIIKDYEEAKAKSDDPFYLFNVTVQNHGGYVGNRGFVDVNVKSKSKGMKSSAVNQYLTLAKKSDDAFKELIEYFKTVKEPTIIVMFGDHQPPLSNKFYSKLFGTDINDFTAEQTADWYSTPYVIWANYDIQEQQNLDMSVNYLSSYMLQLIGADMTGYNKYLLDLQKKIPVLTGLFYQGDDGEFREIDEESEYTEMIHQYSIVQYNGLFDQDNRINEFFFLEGGDYKVPEAQKEN